MRSPVSMLGVLAVPTQSLGTDWTGVRGRAVHGHREARTPGSVRCGVRS